MSSFRAKDSATTGKPRTDKAAKTAREGRNSPPARPAAKAPLASGTKPPKSEAETGLKRQLRLLYEGRSRRAKRFRFALLAFDFVTIAYFLAVSFIHRAPWLRAADIIFATLILLDFAARLWIARDRRRFFALPSTWADIIVIVSLAGTFIVENLAYLRVLRALRLMRSYHMLATLRAESAFFRRNEHVIIASVNLLVYVFVVSALVYTFQAPVNPAINNYIDALYYTVTTLTTTGYGDIVLIGTPGRLLAVGMMIFGAALFLRLAQAIFRPRKVRHRCPQCGLLYHDPDASHCKACGHVLNIPYEGL